MTCHTVNVKKKIQSSHYVPVFLNINHSKIKNVHVFIVVSYITEVVSTLVMMEGVVMFLETMGKGLCHLGVSPPKKGDIQRRIINLSLQGNMETFTEWPYTVCHHE